MKTIFITSFQPFISRNILDSRILPMLLDAGMRVVIFVPGEKMPFFQKQFAHPNVIIEGFDISVLRKSRLTKFFHEAAFLFIDSHYVRYSRYIQYRRHPSVLKFLKYIALSVATPFLRNRPAQWLFRQLDGILCPKSFYEPYFARYCPDLIFAPDIYTDADQALIAEAQRHGVANIGMIRSWDNNYSKGLCRYRPDWTLVNNEGIKNEAVRMHGFKGDHISVVGLPQFDQAQKAPFKSKEAFFSDIGADPSRRIVYVAPAGYPLVPRDADEQMCEMLQEAQNDGRIPADVQFLIVSHPHRPFSQQHTRLGKQFIESKSTTYTGEGKWAELSHADRERIFNALYFSDIVIWTATSLCLDALVFDKPQIMANFDGREPRPYYDSVVKYADEDHLKRFLQTGAAAVANNQDELLYYLHRYLGDPSLDADLRRKGFAQQIGVADGGAGARIGTLLLERLALS